MTKVTRRTCLTTLAAASGVAMFNINTRPAHAAEFSLKLGVDWASDHPSSIQARATCDKLRERTGGRVDIQFFPDNQLGGDTDMLSQVRSGALEMALMPTGVLGTFLPVAAINNIGFAFNGYEQVWHAMDGTLGAHVRGKLTAAGLVVMDKIWDNGFRQITSSAHPINSLADIQGMKIRVPVSPVFTSMFQALGAAPAGANINELYSALQTKVFDGQENPLPNIQFFKMYEVQKYCALTAHMWEGFWLLANRRAWAKLPADLQPIVAETLNDGAMKQRAVIADFNTRLRTQLESEGMSFTQPDRAPFREALRKGGFYANWKQQFGDEAWSILEANTGALS